MTDEKNKPEAETPAEPAETLAEELSEEPAAQGEAQDPAQNSAMSEPDIAAIQAENADLRDRLLRAAAEMENTRKRAEREKQDAARYANAGFARDMLEVSDNLRRALATLKEEERKTADDSVKAMAAAGVTRAVELGPGNVLTGLVRRIEPGLATCNVADEDGFAGLTSSLKGEPR